MSPRDRRALLVGGAIALMMILMLRTVPWAWGRTREWWDRFQAHTELLARARADVHAAKFLEDSVTLVRGKLLALAPKLLSGTASAEAFATLSGQLTAAADRHRVRLERTDAVADSARSGTLRRIAVRGTIEGDTRGTLDFLSALAQDPVVLTIDQVRIVSPDPGAPGTAPEVLRTELTVRGWYVSRERGR